MVPGMVSCILSQHLYQARHIVRDSGLPAHHLATHRV
jgi:hypothetical protein